MPRSKPQPKPAPHHAHHALHPTVSARWLLTAIALVIPAAALCAWAVLCLLFWQGSWQLLYHPTSPVTRTPASVNLAFDPVGFDPTDTGAPQLQGWWIPAPLSPLHRALPPRPERKSERHNRRPRQLHAANVSILAFDYHGYGESVFAHPSEARWRQDTESSLQIPDRYPPHRPHTIVL